MILYGKGLFVVVIVLSILGSFFKFYQKFFWWDLLLHFISGGCFVSIGLGISKTVPTLNLVQMLIFGFTFSMTIHVFWELLEFFCDLLFGLNMQRWHFDPNMPDTHGKIMRVRTPGLMDTMTDFISNILGSVLMCLAYLFLF